MRHITDVKADGSLQLDQGYFSYATGLRMLKDRQWQQLFCVPRRQPENDFTQEHADLALAIQQFTEMVVMVMAREVKRLTKARFLCIAGGVALNGVANGKLLNAGIFEEIFIHPAAGDAGGALGAALAVHYLYFQEEVNRAKEQMDLMNGAQLGPEFSDKDISRYLKRHSLRSTYYSQFSDLVWSIAKKLAKGNIVGWFQGRMEYGPRALGNRSILADARNPDMQQRLNLKIKNRESFRPFAPVVLTEDATKYFEVRQPMLYMNLVTQVNTDLLLPLSSDYEKTSIKSKLATEKSRIPAVTHVDFSSRVQMVSERSNPKLYELLTEFKKITRERVLVNTSFNGADEPIVCTPEDAISCFMKTKMDFLVLGNYVINKHSDGIT